MTVNKNHISNDDNVQGLIEMMENSLEDYNHLQVFLSRDGISNWSEEDEFLMVTPTSFGKVKLLDVSTEDNFIILRIQDCCTQLSGNVRIDINDNNPQTFFINWKDIRRMVLDETTTNNRSDELLDFDF
jgi:hypothetical protein